MVKTAFHITSVHRPDDVRIFLKECRSLANGGYSIHLAYLGDQDKNETIDGVHLHCFKKSNTSRFLRILFSSRKLCSFVASQKPDLVHLHDPELLIHAGIFKSAGIKVVFDAHEDLPLQIMGKHYLPVVLRKPISRCVSIIEKFLTKRLDAIVGATPSISSKFEHFGVYTVCIRNFPLLEEFSCKSTLPKDRLSKDICYIGGIMKSRGIIPLLDSITDLPYRLHLCGDYFPYTLREELVRHPSWKKVIEHGFVGRKEVQKVLSDSSIGIVTLLPQENYIESLPIKMFEYMAAGLPVIASNFPIWKALVEDSGSGICVNPSNPSEIAAAISKIIEDERLCEEMGASGKKAVLLKFNWESESNKLIQLYCNILQDTIR